MSTYRNKWIGRAEQLAGKAVEKIGKKTGQPDVEGEGKGARREGEAREKASRVMLRAQGKAEQVIGFMKEHFGRALGKKRYVIEGKQQKLKGETLAHTNR